MHSMLLLTAMSVGQPVGTPAPAVGGYVYPGVPSVVAAQPTAPPKVLPPAGMPPANMPPTGMPPMGTNGNGNGNGKNGCEACEEKKEEAPEPEPYALMRLLNTTCVGPWMKDHGITVQGWLQGNYTASTAGRSNAPITFNDRANFFQMNQNFLRIDKAIDTSKDEFQWGGRTEWILPGTDARFTISRNLLDDQNLSADPQAYPIDLLQAYIDVYLPNLGPKGTTIRTGKFSTHCGYELMQGAETPFLSRSYMFQYNPFTHTGVYATNQLNDTWTVSNGIVLGSDNFIGTPARPTYIGQLKWAPTEGKSSALFNVVATDPRYDASEAFPFYNYYGMVFTHKFTDKLTYVIDTGFAHIDGAPLPNGTTGSATWYGAANYLLYQINDKWASNFRVEVFEDTKGFRTGSKGLYTGVTYGLAYSPVKSLIIRPTVRYDHNGESQPFEGKSDLFTAAFDVIIRY